MGRSRRSAGLRDGDILAIPRNGGGYYLVVRVASNRFGEALGILNGYQETATPPANWTPVPVKRPVYTGREFVDSGRWERVGHREDVRELFPGAPEIYHSKSDNPFNERIGPFGSGETPTEELRELGKAEAQEIGLIQGTYRQIMLEEEFEEYLQAVLG